MGPMYYASIPDPAFPSLFFILRVPRNAKVPACPPVRVKVPRCSGVKKGQLNAHMYIRGCPWKVWGNEGVL